MTPEDLLKTERARVVWVKLNQSIERECEQMAKGISEPLTFQEQLNLHWELARFRLEQERSAMLTAQHVDIQEIHNQAATKAVVYDIMGRNHD